MEAARVRCVACCAGAVLDRPVFLHTPSAKFRVADTLWCFRRHLGAHTTCSKHGPLPNNYHLLQSGIALGLAVRSPSSPPYLLLLFCLEAVITAAGDLYLSVSGIPERVGYTLLSVFWAGIPFLLLCLLGTLPLQPILPAVNVARVYEVRRPIQHPCTVLI